MRALFLKLEPVIWLLFGQGILIGTILLTGWLLVFGLGVPFGALELDFARAHRLASSLVGRVVLLAVIALPLWKGAHHLRSLSLDFGGAARDTAVASLLYGIAGIGSLLGLLAVIRL